MSKIANEFNLNEIVHLAGAEIPWRTLIEIIAKSKTHEEMLWYKNTTHNNGIMQQSITQIFLMKIINILLHNT